MRISVFSGCGGSLQASCPAVAEPAAETPLARSGKLLVERYAARARPFLLFVTCAVNGALTAYGATSSPTLTTNNLNVNSDATGEPLSSSTQAMRTALPLLLYIVPGSDSWGDLNCKPGVPFSWGHTMRSPQPTWSTKLLVCDAFS